MGMPMRIPSVENVWRVSWKCLSSPILLQMRLKWCCTVVCDKFLPDLFVKTSPNSLFQRLPALSCHSACRRFTHCRCFNTSAGGEIFLSLPFFVFTRQQRPASSLRSRDPLRRQPPEAFSRIHSLSLRRYSFGLAPLSRYPRIVWIYICADIGFISPHGKKAALFVPAFVDVYPLLFSVVFGSIYLYPSYIPSLYFLFSCNPIERCTTIIWSARTNSTTENASRKGLLWKTVILR